MSNTYGEWHVITFVEETETGDTIYDIVCPIKCYSLKDYYCDIHMEIEHIGLSELCKNIKEDGMYKIRMHHSWLDSEWEAEVEIEKVNF